MTNKDLLDSKNKKLQMWVLAAFARNFVTECVFASVSPVDAAKRFLQECVSEEGAKIVSEFLKEEN